MEDGRSMVDGRPLVRFVVDQPGWAHDHKTRNLARCLAPHYRIEGVYQNELTGSHLDEADVIGVYYWLQIKRLPHLHDAFFRNRHKVAGGVCSEFELRDRLFEECVGHYRRFAAAVFAVNPRLVRRCKAGMELPVFYTPNGVDTEFFTPGERPSSPDELVVGWAGSLQHHGPHLKGVNETILPAVRSVPGAVPLLALKEERLRNLSEMREFYRSLDVYFCASSSDGTPNPVLEAAACGIPCLTTKVGQMPEFVKHRRSGYFVRADPSHAAKRLRYLADRPGKRVAMGRRAREQALRWDWKRVAPAYLKVFGWILRGIGSIALVSTLGSCSAATEKTAAPAMRLEVVASGIEKPTQIVTAPGDGARLYVVSGAGRIRVLVRGSLLPGSLLDVSDRLDTRRRSPDARDATFARALFSAAFHPRYRVNGRLFVYYTDELGRSFLEEYRVPPGRERADPDSRRVLMRWPRRDGHYGAQIGFGPDGLLYISRGDERRPRDENRHPPAAGFLRIDVDEGHPYAIPQDNPRFGRKRPTELWATGFRNPWRWWIDEPTGLLYATDVGERRFEEVNVIPLEEAAGADFGWPSYEGRHCRIGNCKAGVVQPVLDYRHGRDCAVIGGPVYRGGRFPELEGHYFYSDYCSGWLRSFLFADGTVSEEREWIAASQAPGMISSLGVDAEGEMYMAVVGRRQIVKVVPAQG